MSLLLLFGGAGGVASDATATLDRTLGGFIFTATATVRVAASLDQALGPVARRLRPRLLATQRGTSTSTSRPPVAYS